MDSEEREHLEELRQIFQKRLRILERQSATHGSTLPPPIQIEIAEVKEQLAAIKAQLAGGVKAPRPGPAAPAQPRAQAQLPWWNWLILIGIGVLLTGLGVGYWNVIAVSASKGGATAASTAAPIAVDSTKDWQSSGISVSKGDTIHIQVVGGHWTTGRGAIPDTVRQALPDNIKGLQIWINYMYEQGGNGNGKLCAEVNLANCPVPSASVGTLIGRIGVSEAFSIGEVNKITASESGTLYLRINDGQPEGTSGLEDNAGILAVEVIVQR
jgi:hypothetical protein